MTDQRIVEAALAWVAEHDGELLRRLALAELDSSGQREIETGDFEDGS